jgi:hypothetical protein
MSFVSFLHSIVKFANLIKASCRIWTKYTNRDPVAPWPGGGQGGHAPPYCWDPSENCQCCRKLSKLPTGGEGGWRFKMLSSGKFFGLSEKYFGLSEKYCPWPPNSMGPTAPLPGSQIENLNFGGNITSYYCMCFPFSTGSSYHFVCCS